MYPQTKLNGSSTPETHPLADGVRDLTRDVISLAELQGQLLLTDLAESRPQLMRSALLLSLAPISGLAGLTLLGFGISTLMIQQYAYDPALAHLLVAGVMLAVAAVCAWGGSRCLTTSVRVLQRSRCELAENVAWLKAVLQSSPQSAARRSSMGPPPKN